MKVLMVSLSAHRSVFSTIEVLSGVVRFLFCVLWMQRELASQTYDVIREYAEALHMDGAVWLLHVSSFRMVSSSTGFQGIQE